jgi:hypothetical protein
MEPKGPQKQQTWHNRGIQRAAKHKLARRRFVRHDSSMKKEFVFQIELDEDMLVATCHKPEMATQWENLDELLAMIRDLIRCRFDFPA